MNARARHFPLFDSLRAIAFGSVFLTHAAFFAQLEAPGVALRPYWARLDVGVYIFFLISAFLLYRPFAVAHVHDQPPPLLRAYAWRRFLRVAPPFWLALTVIGLWFGIRGLFTPAHFPLYYGFAQVYDTHTAKISVLPQAWSLCVEVTFYAFLPLYAAALRRIPLATAAARLRLELAAAGGLLAFGVAYNALIGSPPDRGSLVAHLSLPAFLDYFALGIALAAVSAWYDDRPLTGPLRILDRFPSLAWAAAAAAFVASARAIGLTGSLAQHVTDAQYLERHLLYGVVAFFVLLPAIFGDPRRGLVRRILGARPLLYVGMVSYAAYLFEFATLAQLSRWHFDRLANSTTPYVWFAAGLPIAIALATVSWYGVERPILRLRRLVPARAVEQGEATLEPRAEPAALSPR